MQPADDPFRQSPQRSLINELASRVADRIHRPQTFARMPAGDGAVPGSAGGYASPALLPIPWMRAIGLLLAGALPFALFGFIVTSSNASPSQDERALIGAPASGEGASGSPEDDGAILGVPSSSAAPEPGIDPVEQGLQPEQSTLETEAARKAAVAPPGLRTGKSLRRRQ